MPTFLTIWRRSLCAVSGAIAGGFIGLIIGLAQAQSPLVLTMSQVVQAAVILGLLAWLVLLLIVGVWLHYGVSAIGLPSLVTSLLTSLLTVYLANKVQISLLAVFIGLLAGTLVGFALCRLCGAPKYAEGGPYYGMR